MPPKTDLTDLQKYYIKLATNFLCKQNITEEVYDLYMRRYMEEINNVDTENQQRNQLSIIFNNLKSRFVERSTQGLTQAEHDIEQNEEDILYEKQQEEKNTKSRRSNEKILR